MSPGSCYRSVGVRCTSAGLGGEEGQGRRVSFGHGGGRVWERCPMVRTGGSNTRREVRVSLDLRLVGQDGHHLSLERDGDVASGGWRGSGWGGV